MEKMIKLKTKMTTKKIKTETKTPTNKKKFENNTTQKTCNLRKTIKVNMRKKSEGKTGRKIIGPNKKKTQ